MSYDIKAGDPENGRWKGSQAEGNGQGCHDHYYLFKHAENIMNGKGLYGTYAEDKGAGKRNNRKGEELTDNIFMSRQWFGNHHVNCLRVNLSVH